MLVRYVDFNSKFGKYFFCKYFRTSLNKPPVMKIICFLIFSLITLFFFNTNAQISEGGKPLSMRLFGVNNLDSALQANPNTSSINDLSKTQLRAIKVTQVELTAPDLAPIMKEDRLRNKKTGLFREGVLVPSDISLQNSGKWTILDDGEKIWRLKIHLPGALAIGLYYDHFYLPQGARYFIFNANGHQVLGAYTSDNNPDDDIWANEKAQGDLINLELDLPAGVDTSSAYMHINNVADFYRATEYLDHYKYTQIDKLEDDTMPYFTFGGSSSCEKNAICPAGAAFPDQRMATLKFEYRSGADVLGASGTLMNNTRQNCIPYFLTATHTEATNSTSNSTFSDWIFYFNYETPICTYNGADSAVFYSQSMTGANFVSRASYNSASDEIVGDFLLLQLRQNIPISYNAYFSGWDNSGNKPTGTSISFHHPSGDVKKLATTTDVSPNGNFNDGEPDSHWLLYWQYGGTEEGSSGSGLFETGGYLIGDLSGGSTNEGIPCTAKNINGDSMSNVALYSKFSLNWNYTYETPSTPQSRLHDWLDPGNTGATTLGAIPNTAACIATGTPTIKQSEISVNLYPNPTNGKLFADINLNKISDLKIEIYNMIGARVYEQDVPEVLSGKYSLDISNQPSGSYLVRISTESSSITEKIISFNK
jgi:lysyl endopeptidase